MTATPNSDPGIKLFAICQDCGKRVEVTANPKVGADGVLRCPHCGHRFLPSGQFEIQGATPEQAAQIVALLRWVVGVKVVVVEEGATDE